MSRHTKNRRPSLVIRSKDLAEELGVSDQTLIDWTRDGLLPPRRQIGPKATGYLRAEVEEWLLNRPIAIGV